MLLAILDLTRVQRYLLLHCLHTAWHAQYFCKRIQGLLKQYSLAILNDEINSIYKLSPQTYFLFTLCTLCFVILNTSHFSTNSELRQLWTLGLSKNVSLFLKIFKMDLQPLLFIFFSNFHLKRTKSDKVMEFFSM